MGDTIKQEIGSLSTGCPEFKRALKVLIKYEIHCLLQRLSDTGEEAIVITTSLEDGLQEHLGTSKGEGFLRHTQTIAQLKEQFLRYCTDKPTVLEQVAIVVDDNPDESSSSHIGVDNQPESGDKTSGSSETVVVEVLSNELVANAGCLIDSGTSNTTAKVKIKPEPDAHYGSETEVEEDTDVTGMEVDETADDAANSDQNVTTYVVCEDCGVLCTKAQISQHRATCSHGTGPGPTQEDVKSLNNLDEMLSSSGDLVWCGVCLQQCERGMLAAHVAQHNLKADSFDIDSLYSSSPDSLVQDATNESENVLEVYLYQCKHCLYRCYKKSRMRQHVDVCGPNAGLKPQFGCTICGKALRTKRFLTEHIGKHEEGTIPNEALYKTSPNAEQGPTRNKNGVYECQKCPYTTPTDKFLLKHLETCGVTEFKHKCDVCEQLFKTRRYLTEHMRIHTKNMKCPKCGHGMPHKKQLQKHIAQCTGEASFHTCNICKMTFNTLTHFSKHMSAQHSKPALSKYHSLGLKGRNKLRAKTGDNPNETADDVGVPPDEDGVYRCKKCVYQTTTETHLLKHLETCGVTVFTHQCEVCEQMFKSRRYMLEHMRIHTKNQKCPKCGHGMPHKKQLEKHIAQCSGKASFHTCDICKTTFNTVIHYTRHMNMHSNPNPKNRCLQEKSNPEGYVCHICSYKTMSRRTIKAHLEICGVTETNHQCYLCGKLFTCLRYLNDHILAHKKGDLHPCDKCGCQFTGKKRFEIHRKICRGNGIWFTCEICQKTCRTRRNFLIHKDRHLNGDPHKRKIKPPQYRVKKKKQEPDNENADREKIATENMIGQTAEATVGSAAEEIVCTTVEEAVGSIAEAIPIPIATMEDGNLVDQTAVGLAEETADAPVNPFLNPLFLY